MNHIGDMVSAYIVSRPSQKRFLDFPWNPFAHSFLLLSTVTIFLTLASQTFSGPSWTVYIVRFTLIANARN